MGYTAAAKRRGIDPAISRDRVLEAAEALIASGRFAQATVAEIRALGRRSLAVRADVGKSGDIAAMVAAVEGAAIQVPEAEVQDSQRRIAKTVNFGVIYGMGAQRFARETGVSQAQANKSIDPQNIQLWKMNRRRADYESLRDSVLAVSGSLDFTSGGLPVPMHGGETSFRRTLYGFIDRQNLPGVLRSFDFACPDTTSPLRFQTTVPQQSLYWMNNQFIAAQARALAGRATGDSPAARVTALFQWAFQRNPTAGELDDDGNPRSPDRYDLLLTTDVLSEGVNLQQAGQLVSYDLPFNPMRLVQRHGRIDRIGSSHRRVGIGLCSFAQHCFDQPWITPQGRHHGGAHVAVKVGFVGGGSRRWLDLGIVRLQPSELMKPVIVLAVARFYDMLPASETRRWSAIWPPALLIGIPALAVCVEGVAPQFANDGAGLVGVQAVDQLGGADPQAVQAQQAASRIGRIPRPGMPAPGANAVPVAPQSPLMGMKKGGMKQAKVSKVMHEYGQGKLHSGSKKGPVVKDQKQAAV